MVRPVGTARPKDRFAPYTKKKKKAGSGGETSSYLDTSSSSSSAEDEEERRPRTPSLSPPSKKKPSPKKQGGGKKKSVVVQPPKGKSKKPYRPSAAVLLEIRNAQTVDHCIPRAPFHRLVREVTVELGGNDIRYSLMALLALQEAAEDYVTGVMEDSYLLALHAKRVTLMAKDIQLAYRIRGDGYR